LKTAEPAQTTQATGTTGVQTASGTQIQPPKPPPAQPTAQQQSSGQKLISNVFAGTDIREALSEVASTANVTIIPDDSIKNTLVYMEFRNEPVDSAIRKLALLSGAYVKEQSPGVYLISQATPESGLFRMFSETQSFFTRNTSATAIQAMLPSAYKPFVSFDLKSNHISVTAPSELLPQILGDLRSLDKAPRQFVVEALVTEMDDTGSLNTSFSWNWKNFGVGNDLSLNYTQASQQDVATLIALIGKGKATLRANPRVTAFEGTQTSLTIGQETYFSILSGNVTFPTAQIQLIKTGVTLDFTGYIDDDGTITLNLSPEVSDAVVSVNGNPTTNVRRVSTMVRVKPGDTIAIGGLVQEISSYSTTKVPFLGYIPLIGELFTQRNNTTSKKEVVILITPHFSDSGVGQTGIDSARPAPRP
jgi:type II secretory pathway component GspD/PulD (secretin)